MNPSDHSLWDRLIDICLGVVGAVLATIAGLGLKGLRNMIRDIERSKLRLRQLEDHLGIAREPEDE